MQKRTLIAALSAVAIAFPMMATQAVAATPSRYTPTKTAVDAKVMPRYLHDSSTVDVIVEMAGDPVAVTQAKSDHKLSKDEKAALRASLKNKQAPAVSAIKDQGGTVTADMQSAYNGVAVTLPRSQVAALASVPGVVGVHAAPVHEMDNATSVPYLGVPSIWQNNGYTGKGVKVGIIDSGIDYTHADLMGPGTVDAYQANKGTADPSLFGPNAPRVKGGYDLAGDDYDANGKLGSKTPTPDANPLDCGGHGSHVAGTIGGNGVLPDGTTYKGPYDESTSKTAFRVGPGVAPQADLYSYRIFGCDGSTDLTTQAIDMAVKDGVDVINMSLGSPFGLPDTPDAVAASNAVGAGVVVVAAAGNAGPAPYLAGSPSTGAGVISVAAMDSTASFPGATITFADGKSVTAIDANGVTPPAGALKVVVLKDDPATPENESLGCSVAAYQKAGIIPGGNQLAVSTRGTCARVSKALYAQQAGAAAALMTNVSAAQGMPPFEGTVRENPDTHEAITLTIPFFGVTSADAPVVKGEDGSTATFAATTIPNPGFQKYAGFTSSGPGAGTDQAKPSVSAPGVAIVSLGNGTGNLEAVMSGTSMATPHVTGIAALVKQAHPGWSAQDLSAAIVNTADSSKAPDYTTTLGGAGQVVPTKAVTTQSVMLGDAFATSTGQNRAAALSFGLAEISAKYTVTKDVVIKNNGASAATYNLSTAASPDSQKASVSVSPSSVSVPAKSQATVKVTVTVDPANIPSSEGADFQYFNVSGNVKATGTDGSSLVLPYLMVVRPDAKVTVDTKGNMNGRTGGATAIFKNAGPIAAAVDTYAWGISKPQTLPDTLATGGVDLRAAGVQSYAADDMMVFAINQYTRVSNAAVNEYDVVIDTNNDAKPDYILFSGDEGLVTAGDSNGIPAVFLVNVATGDASEMYHTVAPTDSSTILMPVDISALGLTKDKGTFKYTVVTYSGEDTSVSDASAQWATYNPFVAPVVGESQQATVPAHGSASLRLPVTQDARTFGTLGSMVVSFDNHSGANEAMLIPIKG